MLSLFYFHSYVAVDSRKCLAHKICIDHSSTLKKYALEMRVFGYGKRNVLARESNFRACFVHPVFRRAWCFSAQGQGTGLFPRLLWSRLGHKLSKSDGSTIVWDLCLLGASLIQHESSHPNPYAAFGYDSRERRQNHEPMIHIFSPSVKLANQPLRRDSWMSSQKAA